MTGVKTKVVGRRGLSFARTPSLWVTVLHLDLGTVWGWFWAQEMVQVWAGGAGWDRGMRAAALCKLHTFNVVDDWGV